MNIIEFIDDHYPIKDRVRERLADPYKRVAEMDGLPYDVIGPDENGTVTKLVEIDENTFMPVMELITYTKPDVDKMTDEAFKDAYYAYMDNVDVMDISFVDLQECARAFLANSRKRKEALGVLSV